MGRRTGSSSSSNNSVSPRRRRHEHRRSRRRSRSSSRDRYSSGSRSRRERPSYSKPRAEAPLAHSSRREVKVKTEPLSDTEGVQGSSSTARASDRQRHGRIHVKEEVPSDGETMRKYERFSNFKDYRRREGYRGRQGFRSPDDRRFDRRTRRSPVHWGRRDVKEEETAPIEKEKPNFEITGALAADTNTYKGVVIKYSEPSEARKPKLRWTLYPFKGDTPLPIYEIHRQSAYLFGRDRNIADIPVDHPSCSKQHAVFQYRSVPIELEDGSTVFHVKPYLIDLGSANGTYLNNERMEPQRYYELFEKDVFRFGYSTREYVLLNEKSVDDVEDEQKE